MPGRSAEVQFAFEHDVRASRDARHAVGALFTEPGQEEFARAVALTVSELVTNAIVHAGDGGTVRVWDFGPQGRVRVEVEDHSRLLPTLLEQMDIGGHGLHIVDTIADHWGVDPTASGKVVWAEFNRPL